MKVILLFVFFLLGFSSTVGAIEPALTKEGIQKKVVVIKHDVKLFNNLKSPDGNTADFMTIYFLLEPSSGDYIPVSKKAKKSSPDGWLKKGGYIEWNTLEMIDFSAQGGRKLVKVFDNQKCAKDFSLSGNSSCDEIGEEPQRTGSNQDYKMLIPVFKSGEERKTYEGGFVQVSSGQIVSPVNTPLKENPEKSKKQSSFGYDVVLAIDSTLSMEKWFKPTISAVKAFVKDLKSELSNGEVDTPLRVGLLFYRDRRKGSECSLEYLTKWRVQLTDNLNDDTVSKTISGLGSEKQTECSSEEAPEAVYDALNRVVLDTKWKDNVFKVVVLIGDSPPHAPSDTEKNPLQLDSLHIHKEADARGIRFLTFKIGNEYTTEFKEIALSRKSDENNGRFSTINDDEANLEKALLKALKQDWTELVGGMQDLLGSGIGKAQALNNPSIKDKFKISDYAWPIILSHLPSNTLKKNGDKKLGFSKGWVSKEINKKKAMNEYIFMRKEKIRMLSNTLDSFIQGAELGEKDGPDVLISAIRQALSSMLGMKPDDVFQSGETIGTMMKKAKILPFPTQIFSLDANEINNWKSADFKQFILVLSEKLGALKQFTSSPNNIKVIGGQKFFYVPRHLYP